MNTWKTFTNGMIVSAILASLCYTIIIDRFFVSKSMLKLKNPQIYLNGSRYNCRKDTH